MCVLKICGVHPQTLPLDAYLKLSTKGGLQIIFKSMVLPETQGNKGREIQWPSLGHPEYMSRTVLKVHRQVLKRR
jgi:hypothetical protein